MWEELGVFYAIHNKVRIKIMILISISFESSSNLPFFPRIVFGSWCNNKNDNFGKNENIAIDFDRSF